MKILFITDRLSGGAGMSLLENIRYLKKNNEIFLISSGKGFLKEDFLKELGNNHIEMNNHSWIARKFENSFILSFIYRILVLPIHFYKFLIFLRLIKKIRCDAVIVNTIYLVEGLLAASFLKKKRIIFLREFINHKYYKYNFTKNFIINFIIKYSDYLCCNSHSTFENIRCLLKKKCQINKVKIIPNIIKASKIKIDIRKKYNFPKNKKIIFTASWINPSKKIEDFIKLSKMIKNFLFVIIGDFGGNKNYNKKIKKLIISSNNVFHYPSLINIQKYLGTIDYLVSFGYLDSFNRIVAEGMIEKCISITYKESACKDYIDDKKNGFLISDLNEIKKIVYDLESKDDKKKLIRENAHLTIIEKFSESIVGKKLEKLILS